MWLHDKGPDVYRFLAAVDRRRSYSLGQPRVATSVPFMYPRSHTQKNRMSHHRVEPVLALLRATARYCHDGVVLLSRSHLPVEYEEDYAFRDGESEWRSLLAF